MSEVSFDLEEQRARIHRALEETQKFIAERDKLLAEARKLDRDRWLAPALALPP